MRDCLRGGVSEHIALPRGCLDELEAVLDAHGTRLAVDDQRHLGSAIDYRFHGSLTAVQKRAADSLLKHDFGVFVAPPGVGKTVAGTYLIAERGCSTLVLVHRQPLLEQWVAQLSLFLDVEAKVIGRIGGGKRQITGQIDVAMIQSVVRKGQVDDLVAEYGYVVVDECHHIPAASFERVLSEVKARYVTGLTATPQRRDGHHPIISMQLGPVRFTVDPRSQAGQRPIRHRVSIRETGFTAPQDDAGAPIQALYRMLANDEQRNELILNDVIQSLEDGHSPIVLTERKDHLDFLASRLRAFSRHVVVLKGGTSSKRRRDVAEHLESIPEGEERLLLATGRCIGEGFDDARLDTLFLTMPVSWKGTLVQYAGRLHHTHPDKTEVRIYDYVDREVPVVSDN